MGRTVYGLPQATFPHRRTGELARVHDADYNVSMGRISAASAVLAATAMVIVVATAPNNYPTLSDSWWGHVMPTREGDIDLALIAVSAVLFGISAAITFRRRALAGLSAWFASGCVLYLLSIITWRLHAPVSAGNGG
ncbi:MAG: hypothetical protein QOF27_115 [Gaiellaceae bacterium]|jgi:hypothetical protein|nr:hypothetical protein [Gaiellaceae bacterium]